ncbi:hypothetical protein F3Y22_tig00016637pilonHSYRG00121 [Hibiscus syriacus]|uniref:RNase H type-1 domain-containing protein n=1 Tax=Hibiscus syriacus TaxID=106335 RepID=A0A6A3BWF1_HIBSY|nr:hypothetical protein F3Y22_tig00016637pilonHSYRG00121 [Hibiscus syriacus]
MEYSKQELERCDHADIYWRHSRANLAELLAVLDGFNVAWSHGLRRIIVELDNSEVVRRLKLPEQPNDDAITR